MTSQHPGFVEFGSQVPFEKFKGVVPQIETVFGQQGLLDFVGVKIVAQLFGLHMLFKAALSRPIGAREHI